MASLQKANGDKERLTFGVAEWVAFLTLAIVPATGFGAWAYSTGERIAVREHHDDSQDLRIDRVVGSLDSVVDRLHLIVRHDERLKEVERRVTSLEAGR